MGSCRECSERHNTLCHRPAADGRAPEEGGKVEQTASAASDKTSSSIGTHHVARDPTRKLVLMATALVNATHPNGDIVPLRILLDSASEAHFITQAACNRLGVRRDKAFEMVTGINGNESIVNQCCEVVIRSRCSDASAVVRGFVVPRITKHLPSVEMNRDTLPIPSNVMLADPEFFKRGPIDMLIGAEFFFAWLEAERLELGANLPVLQNTKFGWIVAGSFACAPTALLIGRQDAVATLTCSLEHCKTFDQSIRKFWELESSGTNGITPRSEEVCESDEFFKETTTRSEDGRFIVRLPFNEDPAALGESREVARRRLMQLERRFKNDETLRTRYVEFMRDYLDMGHMSPVVDTQQAPACRVTYLPHHGVIKEASTSTKLRAVFDASSKTSSGKSLNDILRAGPVIQGSLLEIIVRFRFYNVALTGYIRKMYRQVLVHQDDRDYQRILWRFDVDEPVQAFRLNTVTYGQHNFPMASRALMEQTYVDDVLTGARNIEDAALLQEQISKILLTGGFETHKWCSNRAEALERVPPNLREVNSHLCIGNSNTTKTLGIEWNPHEDQFQFVVHGMKAARTKREMLSEIAKLFDPLGLIGPVLTTAKLIMQETWRIECLEVGRAAPSLVRRKIGTVPKGHECYRVPDSSKKSYSV
ncbi:PREDICTED: uncharacterized protein LOC105556771 [Vollenhovia emeryi]|uniref:uncharacterized protein LOC105556771 n=1 Tax=Vollenhovia emeryi TaxID=411798 RepID=UPI0005F574AC|nr:PREDICTED: uncharacterized protein LOC105556771 [Vollenhovia emeryi]